ncbi:hypothetical protein [Rhizobium sp. TRM95796]|uniref:hypothetical protein n=1 Tax=Rhizobium sp. TRM95796 TaxID=2979862 RepID=UPI0021E81CFD|nr:hypothetical protein [Rhizobium sp. TRM95796]MCV3766675.1 hypothetical protein [Rhizobium sp. TRM95796]
MRAIFGTNSRDFIKGKSYDISVFAGAGNDILGDVGRFGKSATNDIYMGARGDDLMFNYSGNDLFYGGAGKDVVISYQGDNFEFRGGGGKDTLVFVVDEPTEIQTVEENGKLVQVTVGDQVVTVSSVEEVTTVLSSDVHGWLL